MHFLASTLGFLKGLLPFDYSCDNANDVTLDVTFEGNIPCDFHLLSLMYRSKILLIHSQVYFRFESKFFYTEKELCHLHKLVIY